ncbi:MAG: methyltransferase domain-containing protein [Candidatus Baltobacteraceae bacterium]
MIGPGAKRYKSSIALPDGELDPASSHGMMVRMVGHRKNVLEVGCASGYMARHLADWGNRVTGIDIDAEAIEEARAYCEETIVADLDARPLAELLQGKRFEVAVFGDVLEHLRDPLRVLRDTRSFLSPDGFVVISIPNVAHGSVRLSLLRGTFEYAPSGLLDKTHLRFFTLRSVRELCVRAGYRIESIERTKVPLFLETEDVPRVDEREFSRELIDEIRRDAEHDTLQFVVRAVPVSDSEHLDLALDALSNVETKFADATAKIDRFERQLEELKSTAERLTDVASKTAAERDRLSEELAALETRLDEFKERAGRRERELMGIAEERSVTIVRLAQEHRAALGFVRLAGEKATQALEELRLEHAALKAEVLEAEAARDALSDTQLDSELQRLRREHEMTVEAFKRHLEADVAMIRAETAQVDGMIREIQRSWVWSAKLLLMRMRRLIPGGRASV